MTTAASAGAGLQDARTIAAVSSAHFASHLLQLALAPLLPMMRDDLGASFTELGLLLAAFYAASGAGQVLAGILVDRMGAHRILLAGITLHALSMVAMGFAPNYWSLVPLAVAAGLGNSVYHPADLSILSQRVASVRLGRAFAFHVIAGALGFALSPVLTGAIAAEFGWRFALVAVGGIATAIALLLFAALPVLRAAPRLTDSSLSVPPAHPVPSGPSFARILAAPVVLFAFAYFCLISLAMAGIQAFAIAALTEGYGATLTSATLAVAGYQIGNASGVFAGGFLADRTSRHHVVALAGLALAVLLVSAASQHWPIPVLLALLTGSGLALGVTTPSRDLLVRRAAPQGGFGRVVGIVYSGFDVGSLAAPLIYGPILDRGGHSLVFIVTGAVLALSMATVLGVRSKPIEQSPRPEPL